MRRRTGHEAIARSEQLAVNCLALSVWTLLATVVRDGTSLLEYLLPEIIFNGLEYLLGSFLCTAFCDLFDHTLIPLNHVFELFIVDAKLLQFTVHQGLLCLGLAEQLSCLVPRTEQVSFQKLTAHSAGFSALLGGSSPGRRLLALHSPRSFDQ